MRGHGGRSTGPAKRGLVSRCSLALAALVALGLAHCGGESVRHVTDGEGAEAGNGASGGATSPGGTGGTANGGSTGGNPAGGTSGTGATGPLGGTSGTGPTTGDCNYRGDYYDKGDEFVPEDDPKSLCVCNNVSRIVCTDRDPTKCTYEGAEHPINESFPTKDGCNSCSCNERGDVICTHRACETDPVCYDLQAKYQAELTAQKRCPLPSDGSSDGCVVTSFDSLPCGCEVGVHDPSTLDVIAQEYFADGCGQDPTCPPCPLNGLMTYCLRGTCVLGGGNI